MVLSKSRLLQAAGVGMVWLLAACSAGGAPPELVPPTRTPELQPTTVMPAAPEPLRVLSVCLGEEPASLFLYRDDSDAADIIRQALYDGPVDQVNYQTLPVILQRIPGLDNGDVRFQAVLVQPGEPIVSAGGELTRLVSGIRFRPAGCREAACVETYQGSEAAELDQLVVDFRIKPDVYWSDGEPLTAEDSVFSFETARDYYGEQPPRRVALTASYRLLSETRVRWRGIPGFQSPHAYSEYFFFPFPGHLWGEMDLNELLFSDLTNRQPLGWGPYSLDEWVTGEHLSLNVNPYYSGWSSRGPVYDRLVFRFMEDVPETLDALAAGECEVAAALGSWMGYYERLKALEEAGELRVVHREGGAWDQITFGIRSLDNRVPFFAQPEVRQAAALCINRPGLVRQEPRAGSVASSYVPANHPSANRDINLYPYNPGAGERLLADAGWEDADQDPSTPRTAQGVSGVPDGTPFEITFLVFEGEQDALQTQIIVGGLEACGLKTALRSLPAEELLAPGPDGPVFGRRFDLTRFAWSRGNFQLCSLFLGSEIPGPYPDYPKGWGGANAAGFQDAEFDQACRESLTGLPDSASTVQGFQGAQEVFGAQLPAIPLYFRREVVLTAPDFYAVQSGDFIPLWNIEDFQ